MKNYNWTPQARYYDFGRPFPSRYVNALFYGCKNTLNYLKNEQKVICYEPGVGTGRMLIPLAEIHSDWEFFGTDVSIDMLTELNFKKVCQSLQNIHTIHHDSVDFFLNEKCNLLIISSLLHAVKKWECLVNNLINNNLSNNGIICLIGEEGDIYNFALGRYTEKTNNNLCLFWEKYIEVRKLLGIPNPEQSQIGCKWEVNNNEPANYIINNGFTEIDSFKFNWEQFFTIDDLLNIVKERCYSSMFTVDEEIYIKLVEKICEFYKNKDVSEYVVSKHTAIIRCFKKI